MANIVLIEDEAVLGRQIARALEASEHEVCVAQTASDGLRVVRESEPDIVLLDLRLPDRSGLDLLPDLREQDDTLPVVMMTAYGSVQDAVEAMRLGACDYLQKPLDLDELRLVIERALSRHRQERELAYHRGRNRTVPDHVIGQDPRLHAIFQQVERLHAAGLAPAQRPAVLLTGETGTGKGVVARAIHEMLGGGPFIEVNCTAVPSSLVEAELFGHERGSFTDARAARTGLFEAASGGTIFLDEIGHLELDLQAKFLKVIEEKRIRRIGATRDRPVDVHVVAATNRDLDEAVAEGAFRSDLLHRLRVLAFEIPPLRERAGDLLLLARHFCRELSHIYGGGEHRLSEEAERVLLQYGWPGNVRELRNVIERAVLVASKPELGPESFAALLSQGGEGETRAVSALPEGGINLAELEKDLIRQALERTGGNRTRAAAMLGLSRDTLRYRLEKFGLE